MRFRIKYYFDGSWKALQYKKHFLWHTYHIIREQDNENIYLWIDRMSKELGDGKTINVEI